MNINKLNPYIRRATKSVLTHPFSMNERVILDYEIIYVESGNMRIVYNSNEFICPPGSFVLIHPDVPHAIKSTDSNISQPHIHFDLEYDINSKNIFI